MRATKILNLNELRYKADLNEWHYSTDLVIVAENFFFWTEADLKSNTPHELYSVITELHVALRFKQ